VPLQKADKMLAYHASSAENADFDWSHIALLLW
jgi:hypothetical protein